MRFVIDHEESQRVSKILHTIGEGDLRTVSLQLGHKPRKELHLTDDLYCPMKAYCRVVLGLKAKINRRTAGRFLIGNVYDALFKLPFDSVEVELKLDGCPSVGHPDVVEYIHTSPFDPAYFGGVPIEAKHTTKTIMVEEDIPEKWVRQLALEMVYCGVVVGNLAIGEVVSTLITVWRGSITQSEFNEVKKMHIAKMNHMDICFKNRAISHLTSIRKECRGCFYNYKDGCPRRPK